MNSQFSVVGKSEDSLDPVTHRKARFTWEAPGFTWEATAVEEPYLWRVELEWHQQGATQSKSLGRKGLWIKQGYVLIWQKKADYESKHAPPSNQVPPSWTTFAPLCGSPVNRQISPSRNIALSVLINLSVSMNTSVDIISHPNLDL